MYMNQKENLKKSTDLKVELNIPLTQTEKLFKNIFKNEEDIQIELLKRKLKEQD